MVGRCGLRPSNRVQARRSTTALKCLRMKARARCAIQDAKPSRLRGKRAGEGRTDNHALAPAAAAPRNPRRLKPCRSTLSVIDVFSLRRRLSHRAALFAFLIALHALGAF